MPQSRLELVKTMEGSGRLIIEAHEAPVRYVIRVFREMLDAGAGEQVPGLITASGQLHDFRATDAVRAIGKTARLLLEDGMKCDVIVTDQAGAFQVSGPIA
jgi:hypothetical protein